MDDADTVGSELTVSDADAVAVSPTPSVAERWTLYVPEERVVLNAGVVYVEPVPVRLYEYPVPVPPITEVRKN